MMHRRTIVKNIRAASMRVRKEISNNAQSAYGRGLSNEGYAGGYQQALSDVLLMLESDTMPNTRGYWPEPCSEVSRTAAQSSTDQQG